VPKNNNQFDYSILFLFLHFYYFFFYAFEHFQNTIELKVK
jgi:hypothetical protein